MGFITQTFKNSHITRAEYLFLIIYSCFITGLVLIPSIYGSSTAPPDRQFMHNVSFPMYAQDIDAYLSWIKQVQGGNFLLKIKYTPEEHSPIFFNPLFLMAGLASFQLSIVQVLYLFQILANLFFLFSLYLFISYFIQNKPQRFFAFILSTLAGGFGWIFYNDNFFFRPIDAWMPEATIFQSIRWPFMFTVSISLILWSFLLMIKSWEMNKLTYAFGAGLAGFTLTLIHPYDTVLILSVMSFYFLFCFSELKKKWKNLLIFFWLSALPLLYHLYVLKTSSVFNKVFSQFRMYTPHFLAVLEGVGPIFILAVIGLLVILIARRYEKYFLLAITWIFIVSVLIYCPFIPYQRRLIMGIYIPLGMFASLAPTLYWQRVRGSQSFFLKTIGILSLGLLLLFLSLGNLFILKRDLQVISHKIAPFYLEKEVVQAMTWLGEHSFTEEIVLSSPTVGKFIPVISGNTVFIGHTALTINYCQKYQKAKWFFNSQESKEELTKFLGANNIKYIFISPYEKEGWEGNDFQFSDNFDDFLVKIYQNRLVTIYQFPHL